MLIDFDVLVLTDDSFTMLWMLLSGLVSKDMAPDWAMAGIPATIP